MVAAALSMAVAKATCIREREGGFATSLLPADAKDIAGRDGWRQGFADWTGQKMAKGKDGEDGPRANPTARTWASGVVAVGRSMG